MAGCVCGIYTRAVVFLCVGACSRACAFALGLGFASMPASPPPPSSEKSAASSIRPCCITLIGRPVGSPFGSPCIQRWGRRQPASRRRRRLGCRERWSRRRHPVHSLCVAYPNMLEQGADGGTHTHTHTEVVGQLAHAHTHTQTHTKGHTHRDTVAISVQDGECAAKALPRDSKPPGWQRPSAGPCARVASDFGFEPLAHGVWRTRPMTTMRLQHTAAATARTTARLQASARGQRLT